MLSSLLPRGPSREARRPSSAKAGNKAAAGAPGPEGKGPSPKHTDRGPRGYHVHNTSHRPPGRQPFWEAAGMSQGTVRRDQDDRYGKANSMGAGGTR